MKLILALLGAAFIAIFIVSWSDAQSFESDLTDAGFSNVSLTSPLSNEKATVDVHGCKLGIDNTGTSNQRRTIAGHELPMYSVDTIATNDTWVAIPEMANKASTPDEIAQFLAAHRDAYPCYKP